MSIGFEILLIVFAAYGSFAMGQNIGLWINSKCHGLKKRMESEERRKRLCNMCGDDIETLYVGGFDGHRFCRECYYPTKLRGG